MANAAAKGIGLTAAIAASAASAASASHLQAAVVAVDGLSDAYAAVKQLLQMVLPDLPLVLVPIALRVLLSQLSLRATKLQVRVAAIHMNHEQLQ
jgi:hypothetical protein